MSIVNALVGTTAGKTAIANSVVFTNWGTYYWEAPPNVTNVHVVCVGGGGGGSIGQSSGGGGGLGWKNNIAVVPGQVYTVVVGRGGVGANTITSYTGDNGGNSYFISTSTVMGMGGAGGGPSRAQGGAGGGYVGDGGGNGGNGGTSDGRATSSSVSDLPGGGGGAGGYTGNGGRGGDGTANNLTVPTSTATAGSGGGGGGGNGGWNPITQAIGSMSMLASAGGGVNIFGIGSSGAPGLIANTQGYSAEYPTGGRGGSSGADGGDGKQGVLNDTRQFSSSHGGFYGGGGGASFSYITGFFVTNFGPYYSGDGGSGAVRIIWGPGRSFPNNAS